MRLAIRSLNTQWRSAQPLPAQRLQAWVDSLAAQDGDALAAGLVRDDEWLFVRRLPLQLRWRADAAEAEVGAAWQASLAASLAAARSQAVAAPGAPEVLRYAHRHDALADLLYRSALGETQRQWAWQRMALLPRSGMSAAQALEHGSALLLRDAPAVWPVLARLWAGEADCASLSALLRGWSAARWREVLQASPVTRPYVMAPAPGDAPEAAAVRTARPTALNSTATALQAWARRRPQLVADRAQAVAALMAALMEPGAAPTATHAAQRQRAAMRLLPEAAQPRVAQAEPTAAPGLAHASRAATLAPAPVRERAEAEPPLPPLPHAASTGLVTQFGGLLFWLGQLQRLGMVKPGDEPPGALALRALARALGVPDDDPATAAFCGGAVPDGEASAEVEAAAQAHAQRIAEWLDEAAPDLPPPRTAAVCRRAGQLHLRPGWIELRLPLANVDTAVRRLGLDLDPGWLPWLGCVVSIRYED